MYTFLSYLYLSLYLYFSIKENGVAITGNYAGGSISVVSLNKAKLSEVVQV